MVLVVVEVHVVVEGSCARLTRGSCLFHDIGSERGHGSSVDASVVIISVGSSVSVKQHVIVMGIEMLAERTSTTTTGSCTKSR